LGVGWVPEKSGLLPETFTCPIFKHGVDYYHSQVRSCGTVYGSSPGTFGQNWNIQFMMVPVIPKLIKGTLFGE